MTLTTEQWQSVIRAVGVAVGSILVYAGVTNMTRVGDAVNTIVDQAPIIISSVSALVTAGTAVWGVLSHSNISNIEAVKAVPGQGVVVGPTAPPEAQKMAADPLVKKVDFVNPEARIARHL
jgi:hypothetical protein